MIWIPSGKYCWAWVDHSCWWYYWRRHLLLNLLGSFSTTALLIPTRKNTRRDQLLDNLKCMKKIDKQRWPTLWTQVIEFLFKKQCLVDIAIHQQLCLIGVARGETLQTGVAGTSFIHRGVHTKKLIFKLGPTHEVRIPKWSSGLC